MLMPVQVVPFLLHEDVDVREQAIHYLADMADLAPPETAEQAWLGVERFGGEPSQFGSRQSGGFLRLIAGFTPTDTTAQKTIERLRGTTDKEDIYWNGNPLCMVTRAKPSKLFLPFEKLGPRRYGRRWSNSMKK